MPAVLISFARLLQSAALWAAGASVVTATLSALGRALCLPPYWPRVMVLRCRPDGLPRALMLSVPDAMITTLMLFVPALLLGAGIHLLVTGLQRLERPRTARVMGALAGAGCWIALALRLEPSYLDYILGEYAIAAGAAVGAAVGGWWIPRRADRWKASPDSGVPVR